jgi:hypothetical protein
MPATFHGAEAIETRPRIYEEFQWQAKIQRHLEFIRLKRTLNTRSIRSEGFRNTDSSVLFADNKGTKDFVVEKNTKAPEGTAAYSPTFTGLNLPQSVRPWEGLYSFKRSCRSLPGNHEQPA